MVDLLYNLLFEPMVFVFEFGFLVIVQQNVVVVLLLPVVETVIVLFLHWPVQRHDGQK